MTSNLTDQFVGYAFDHTLTPHSGVTVPHTGRIIFQLLVILSISCLIHISLAALPNDINHGVGKSILPPIPQPYSSTARSSFNILLQHDSRLSKRTNTWEYLNGAFCGDTNVDFACHGVTLFDDGNHISSLHPDISQEMTDVSTPLTWRSGFDMRSVSVSFDYDKDTLAFGVHCYGICGDADGDGYPDSSSMTMIEAGGLDMPALGLGEFLYIFIDPQGGVGIDFNPRFVIGSSPSPSLSVGYSEFGLRLITNASGIITDLLQAKQFHSNFSFSAPPISPPSSSFIGNLVDPQIRLIQDTTNAHVGDIEFTIVSFSEISHLLFNETLRNREFFGELNFSFEVVMGSLVSGPVGVDYLTQPMPGGKLVGRKVAITCPFDLDPFGSCCSPEFKDFCGVCNGSNQNLDSCGVCRTNASLVSPTLCPAASAQSSTMDSSQWPDLINNASNAITSTDLDADGILELVSGNPVLNQLSVAFFHPNGTIRLIIPIASQITNSGFNFSLSDGFGYAVADIGDLNGDYIPDLAVSAPGYNNSGALFILLMNFDGSLLDWRLVTPYIPPWNGAPAEPNCLPSSSPPSSPNANDPVSTPSEFYYEPNSSPSAASSPSNTTSPTCKFSSPLTAQVGSRFGSSIILFQSASATTTLLVSAPGTYARNSSSLSTDFQQLGGLFLVALATDGNLIGISAVSMCLEVEEVIDTPIDGSSLTIASLAEHVQPLGWSSTPGEFLVAIDTVFYHNVSDYTPSNYLFIGAITSIGEWLGFQYLYLPTAPIQPLPEIIDSTILSGAILAPNSIPQGVSSTDRFVTGTGDINADGNPDLVIGLPHTETNSGGLLMVCLLSQNNSVIDTYLLGIQGIGHYMQNLSGSIIGSSVGLVTSAGILLGTQRASGTTMIWTTVISDNLPSSVSAITLWGSAASLPPTNLPPLFPGGPSFVFPPSTSVPFTIIPPSLAYPTAPLGAASPITVTYENNSPTFLVSAVDSPAWVLLNFAYIVERSSSNATPLKTLYFPPFQQWSSRIVNNAPIFNAFLVTAAGLPTSVSVQIETVFFIKDAVVVFTNQTYFGVHGNTHKFSLLMKGWTFVAPKTVLDIYLNLSTDSPILSVQSPYYPTEHVTRFTMSSVSSDTLLTVPSFAAVDGILSNLNPPSFNQSSKQLVITVPPFANALFYDPDVCIFTSSTPSAVKAPLKRVPVFVFIIVAVTALAVVIFVTAILGARTCRQKRAERAWKDAGSV